MAAKIAREKCVWQSFGKRFRIWAVAHHEKLHGEVFFPQLSIGACQNIEIFLAGNAADIEQAHLAVPWSEFLPETRVAPLRIEKLGIETARENL